MEEETFRCEQLACKLSRGTCSERFVRADALRLKEQGGFEPAAWLRYVPCRGCAIGRAHATMFSTKAPGKGPPRRPDAPVRLPVLSDAPMTVEVEVRLSGRPGRLFIRCGAWFGGPFTDEAKARRWLMTRRVRVIP